MVTFIKSVTVDCSDAQLEVPGFVAVHLAQPVGGAVPGQPSGGVGVGEIDRVAGHVGGGLRGRDPAGGLRRGSVGRDRVVEQSLLVRGGAPAAVDDELDAVAGRVGGGSAQRR